MLERNQGRYVTVCKCFALQDVQFEVADATKREYQPEVFDVIYSRDTILHISDKLALFKNFYVSDHSFCLMPPQLATCTMRT